MSRKTKPNGKYSKKHTHSKAVKGRWLFNNGSFKPANRLKLNNEKAEALLAGSSRRVSVTHDDRFNHDISVPHDDRFNHDISVPHDDHLRAGNYDISFKGHVKDLGVYTDATVYSDHISRSADLEIRRISSIRHLLATKATAQLMCSFVLSRLDYGNSLLIDINCDQM